MTVAERQTLYNVYRGILNNNPSFQPGETVSVEYRFDCPEYETLRERYHLAKIAGEGTDLQRGIRLLKYFSPKLVHNSWYDNSIPCNALALLDYSLNQPEHGINCLNKAKILEECCLALGIYARRICFLPYSPFDSDCHVVTELYDRAQKKWCMLDPSANGYLVDENETVLSLLEARERMAKMQFVTFCKATSRTSDLQKLARKNLEWNVYYAKNLFRMEVDAVSQFGEAGQWLKVVPEHFSIKRWSMEKAAYRLRIVPEYAKAETKFDLEKILPRFQAALKEAEAMQEPRAVAISCLMEPPC